MGVLGERGECAEEWRSAAYQERIWFRAHSRVRLSFLSKPAFRIIVLTSENAACTCGRFFARRSSHTAQKFVW